MPATLGVSYVERIADKIGAFLVGTSSLVWLHIGDSNLSQQTGSGYGRQRRLTLAALTGRPSLAVHTLLGSVASNFPGNLNYANGAGGPGSDWVNDGLAPTDHDTNYASAHAAIRPYTPTTANMQAIDTFPPALPINGATPTAARCVLAQEATATGYNWDEQTNIYMAHVRHADFGSHTTRCRGYSGSYYTFLDATIDHSPVGAPSGASDGEFAVELLGSIAAGAMTTNLPAMTQMQLAPYGVGQTLSGTNPVLSMFATWPSRGHGHIVAPFCYKGGSSLYDLSLLLADAENEWIDWRLLTANAALEGRSGHLVFDIQHGLNDRNETGLSDDAATFAAVLSSVLTTIRARYDALRDAGSLPGLASITFLFSGCNHRIHSGQPSVAYTYTAARTVAASRSDLVVADFQDSITDAWADEMTTDWSHLSSAAHYLANDTRWLARFLAACRLSQRARRIG